ncbi:hypothetical protein [Paenibacillus sp. FSL R7-0337]|uniref:hypothetical protein n=1 Tax=Paenibacillus sp. FSL R7-0337 TaxID=1926588 RepID=UPI00096D2D6E|nr:hypothetical protein [Paenibacillus sp. FSL R7-0337]OMF98445.1 hypothetical protein BK147_09355 [Paenibacillus sp. FSL R7-0337]
MSVILPVREPVIKSYTSYGCLFSIVGDETWPWIFNNFIQIRYARGWEIYTFDNHHMLLQNCPGLSFYILPQEIVKLKFGSLKKTIIDAIDNGYYLFIFIDRYYLHVTDSYEKEHFFHELFIFGYDIERDIVFIADNLVDGKYITTECPFSELEEGYTSIVSEYSFMTDIRFLKPNSDVDCKINLKQIIYGLENYLHSKRTFDLLEEQEFQYGFNAIKLIFDDLDGELGSLDYRAFHFLYEHKILMELRLKYLADKAIIGEEIKSILSDSQKLKNNYLLLRNLVLKYNITLDGSILKSISNRLSSNIKEEQNFINALIKILNEVI